METTERANRVPDGKIILPDKESVRDAIEEYKQLLSWAQGLSEKQLNFLCDGGWYNDTIKGYLISAATNAGFSEEQIRELLRGLRYSLDEKTKEDAEGVYMRF